MKARNRDDMVQAFQTAFEEWYRRHAKAADGFVGVPSAECGAYFADLLDELSGGQPWADIGPGHPAEP